MYGEPVEKYAKYNGSDWVQCTGILIDNVTFLTMLVMLTILIVIKLLQMKGKGLLEILREHRL